MPPFDDARPAAAPASQRDALPADLPAVAALFRDSFTATFGHLYRPADLQAFFAGYTPERWRAVHADPETVLRLATRGGVPAGFANLGTLTIGIDPGEPAAELRQLYLAAEAKGTGVADALMAWALASARARGARALYLTVYVDNHRARRFYARHGFADVGRYDYHVGGQVDEDRILRLAL